MKTHDLEQIWKTTLAQIEVKLDSPPHFKTWFLPTELKSIDGRKAIIGVRNSYASDWLKKKYYELLQDRLSHVAGKDLDLDFVISKEIANEALPSVSKSDQEQSQSSLLNVRAGVNMDFNDLVAQSNLNPDFSLSHFVVGPSNRLAQAASLAVIENPGTVYNPLFIHGDTGLGKTHLAHAVGIKLLEKKTSRKVLYKPSENFLNEMVSSIKSGKTNEFRNKYRYLDLLILDDIQLISKWEQTQDELFNTFNALRSKNKQIILISDRAPEKIHNLESRLLSRFQGGMIIQVEKPDFETRLAILKAKCSDFNINLPDDVLEHMAKNVTENIRKLEGSLHQIALYNRIHSSQISPQEVASILGTDIKSKREKIKPRDVMRVVAKEFQVTSKDILGRTRKADIAFARQVVMYILRTDFGYKLEDVAHALNRKDHTTVIHAVDKIQSKIELEKSFQEQMEQLRVEMNS
ncbi:chromosomal replication initiator protein DnaA [Candidatus Dojkabacteria bacterium]|uniref:Chromosomal replication initiator protein DnaA n=1 Tax=Candidatus Dojkabacteria bacterium TaxID=2099670 RepID=A0A955L9L3_9BACT|nr:chromosomal replication initiator protein DnaA [Candidatus Dojkabacteria bacterium]